MYRIRIILMSMFLFLLVGANMSVRASVNSDEILQDSKSNDQSKSESQDHETDETISQLDFFGAFSLVNVQLQWRDLHLGLNDEFSDVESSDNKKEQSITEVKTLSLDDENQIVPASGYINSAIAFLPTSVYKTIDGSNHFNSNQDQQFKRTIAYILNCGTYPKSC